MAVNETWKRRLIARHPVLDFVNTLDNRFAPAGPEERLSRYDELLDFLHTSALITLPQMHVLRRLPADPRTSLRTLRRVRVLREKLASIMYVCQGGPPSSESLRGLQIEFAAARRHLALKWTRNIDGHAFWDWSFPAPHKDWPLWILARAAESLLLSEDMASVRQCAQSSCRWLFLDASKNRSRRWCDMKLCGNRAKAARFQARHSD